MGQLHFDCPCSSEEMTSFFFEGGEGGLARVDTGCLAVVVSIFLQMTGVSEL